MLGNARAFPGIPGHSRAFPSKKIFPKKFFRKDVFGSKSMGEKKFFFSGGRPPGRPKKIFFKKFFFQKFVFFPNSTAGKFSAKKNFFDLGVPPRWHGAKKNHGWNLRATPRPKNFFRWKFACCRIRQKYDFEKKFFFEKNFLGRPGGPDHTVYKCTCTFAYAHLHILAHLHLKV